MKVQKGSEVTCWSLVGPSIPLTLDSPIPWIYTGHVLTLRRRYNTIGTFLKSRFGKRIYKVSLHGGFTCPNRDGTKGWGGCVYCQPKTLIGEDFGKTPDIEEQLTRGIGYLKRRYRAEGFIAYFQSYSNTYAPPDRLEGLYRRALNHPEVVGLAVSTRPDTVDAEVLDLLCHIGRERFLWVEYGLQSARDETLRLIGRAHTVEDFLTTYEMTVKRGIRVCVHIILGLPGEGREEMMETARFLGRLNPWGVKIHHLQIHRGTRLEGWYRKGLVRTLDLEEYIPLVVEFLELLPSSTIIHRVVGDAPQDLLVAPQWGSKLEVLRAIDRYMIEKDTWQGRRCGAMPTTHPFLSE